MKNRKMPSRHRKYLPSCLTLGQAVEISARVTAHHSDLSLNHCESTAYIVDVRGMAVANWCIADVHFSGA